MIELFDNFSWTKENKTITKEQHQVPGLGNFTHWNFNYAPPSKPMHFHSDIMEIHCMVNGQRVTRIEIDKNMHSYKYTGNQAFITFPYEVHGSSLQTESPCEFYAFQLILSDKHNLLGLNPIYSEILYNILTGLKYRQFSLGSSSLRYLRTAFNLFSDKSNPSTLFGTQFLNAFLLGLPFLQPAENETNSTNNPNIAKSVEYILNNICTPLRLQDIAIYTGYSLSRFKTKFKEEIGISPAEYIQLEKINLAKQFLIETDISITDISFKLGFSSSNYFSYVFKKYTNYKPLTYRKTRR